MSRIAPLPLPKAHDIVRLVRPFSNPTVDGTYRELRRHYDKGGMPSYYAEVKALVPAAFGHQNPLSLLVRSCQSFRLEKSRELGPPILRAAWAIGSEEFIVKPKKISWSAGASASMTLSVDADFIYIKDRKPFIFSIQPRLSCVPDPDQLGLLYRIFLVAADAYEYEDVTLQFLDFRLGSSGERLPRLIGPERLVVPPKEVAEQYLQIFLEAYNKLISEGYQRPRRSPQDPKGQDPLFPGSPRNP